LPAVDGVVTPLVPPPAPYVTVMVWPAVSESALMMMVLPLNVGTMEVLAPTKISSASTVAFFKLELFFISNP